MKIIRIIGILLAIVTLYIASAYISKQTVLSYYKWHDKDQNWLSEYEKTMIKSKYKIVFIISDPTIIADREAGKHILAACHNLGWETHDFEMIEGNEDEIKAINPDFIFTNKWNLHFGLKEKFPGVKMYALLPHPTSTYFSGFFDFYPQFKTEKFPELKFIDGFIVSMPQISLFKNLVEKEGKKFYGFKGYSSVQYQSYVETEPKQLVYMGMNWDSRRKSGKFTKVFKTLAEKERIIYYGSYDSWAKIAGDAYKGFFPSTDNAVVEKLRENGINLVLHSKQHMINSTPSGRDFETAAAGVIGISDRHPFLVDNFGNNFLYIDVDSSSSRIVDQIEKHLEWINNNPEKAKKKAKQAYDIFIKKYTLENLLIDLAHMHEKILLDEKGN
ncbi:MAG: hypothetical protein AABY27_02910 [Pseudomonadota bacterium]